ncbi:MAG: hypothetical protein DDT32_02056 [Syntrophomonadaceae bacterium]|nr:hypothetical protein [Bacillota bacterium]MBT9148284.1 hypothetical protein [Bacillota bacterium]
MWYWCLHCERAQWQAPKREDCATVSENGRIPYPNRCKFDDCDGGIGDIWSYEETRKDYPEIAAIWAAIPEEGRVYPLYEE